MTTMMTMMMMWSIALVSMSVLTTTTTTTTTATMLLQGAEAKQRLPQRLRRPTLEPWSLRTPQSLPTYDFLLTTNGGAIQKKIAKSKALTTQSTVGAPQNVSPVLIRILFLTYYASLGSLMPYLPVYYKSLGHGGLIIGLLGAVKPSTTFVVAPLWGILSDGSGNRFGILYFTFLVSMVSQLLVAVRKDVPFLVTMVFVTAIFNAPVKSLIDSLVMDNLENKADYGRLRLWGQLGFGLGSSGVGVMLSKYLNQNDSGEMTTTAFPPWDSATYNGPLALEGISKALYELWMNITGYRLFFLTYAALSIPAYLCLRVFERREQAKAEAILKMNKDNKMSSSSSSTLVPTKRRSDKTKAAVTTTRASSKSTQPNDKARIGQGLSLLLHNSDAMLFFFLVFVVGVSSGLIENFAHVRIAEVGGGGREMGLSRLISSLAGAPMFWFSGPLTELLGADRVLVVSLLSYVTRFFIYASMKNPYQGLPAEALRGVT